MKMLSSLFSNYRFILGLYIVLAVAAGTQGILLSPKKVEGHPAPVTNYNNYIIFKQSYFHLIDKKDLYIHHPQDHFDLYKYSPAFSLFFSIFAYLPDWAGLNFWNLLNALVFLAAVYYLPGLGTRQKNFILLVCAVEMMTCMQNEQSNGLVAGLLILAFGLLERDKYPAAAFCIAATIFIKVLGVAAFSLFLFYPAKWKLALYSLLWILLFSFIPLLVVDFSQLKFLYSSWGNLLANDFSGSYGLSVINWLKTWFGLNLNKTAVILAGAIIYCIPLLKFKSYKNYSFRLHLLASLLIWVVIFNHKAESPTFIIAMSGVAIWYFSQNRNAVNLALFIAAFILASLSPTDIFPRSIRENWVAPFVLKAVPCIIIWLKIVYEMLFDKIKPRLTAEGIV